jgi:hypothetical protein
MYELIGDHYRCCDCANEHESQSRVSGNFPLLIVHNILNRIQRGPFRLRPRHVAAPYALMLEGVEYRLK